MTIHATSATRRRRFFVLGPLAALVAAGTLLPAWPSSAEPPCPTTTSHPSAPTQVSAADQATILQLHNQYRNEVGVAPLTWDSSLAERAQGWANVTAALGRLCHEPGIGGSGQGENLADNYTVEAAIHGNQYSWYTEKAQYDSNPEPVDINAPPGTNWHVWGHYSQMVWRSTQHIGCGQAPSQEYPGNVVLDCRYSPPGNYDGQRPY